MGVELIFGKRRKKNGARVQQGKYPNLLLQFFVSIVDTELLEGVLDGAEK